MRVALVAFVVAAAVAAPAFAEPSAVARMQAPGPEHLDLARRAGTWDVVETVWDRPGAQPIIAKWVAVRTMYGPFLQEILQPVADAAASAVERIDYLSYNRIEGRWKYVSMDMRFPAGMMPAASLGRGTAGKITVIFDAFAMPGSGTVVSGQMLRMEQDVVLTDSDHDVKEQRFTLADGNGQSWLAHRYSYTRRP